MSFETGTDSPVRAASSALSAFCETILAIGLREDDELIEVKVTDESDLIYLVSQKGMSICFKQDNVSGNEFRAFDL